MLCNSYNVTYSMECNIYTTQNTPLSTNNHQSNGNNTNTTAASIAMFTHWKFPKVLYKQGTSETSASFSTLSYFVTLGKKYSQHVNADVHWLKKHLHRKWSYFQK